MILTVFLACSGLAHAGDWPGWRGPTGMGAAENQNLPLTWGGKDEQTVRWKAELPKAHNAWSSPIVCRDRVFLTTSTFDPKDQQVLCFRKDDGKLLWSTAVAPGPWRLEDTRSTYCAPTPTTDGKLVYVVFGSAVVAALDFDGKVVWRRNLARYAFDVAQASSPVLYGDTLILLCDQNERKSSLAAFDTKTGEVRWEVMRPDQAYSHSTPLLTQVGGKPLLLISASNAFQGVDPANGKVIWWCSASGDVATPVCSAGVESAIAYCDDGRGGEGVAVRAPGTGDVTGANILWKLGGGGEALSSPIIVGDYLYRLRPSKLICVDLKTGKKAYEERLPGVSTWSSPIATTDRLYFASAGKSIIVKAGPQFEILATNDLGDENGASPAVSDGLLFLRGNRFLYCVGKR